MRHHPYGTVCILNVGLCMHCMSMCVPASVRLLCWSGLAQSVIQVRPTGSGLMRIGSALSGSRPGVEAVCGAQGKKRNAVEHTSSPSLETAKMQPNSQKILIYPGIMTQLNALDSSEAQLDKVFWRHSNLKRNQSSNSGGPVHTPFLLV